MGREKKNRIVRRKDLLRPVAVMDVPIDDRHTFSAMPLLGMAGGDRNVVEYAKSHGRRRAGMMAGRPYRTESILHSARQNGVHCVDDATHRPQSDFSRFF